jgi:hypothetical protein
MRFFPKIYFLDASIFVFSWRSLLLNTLSCLFETASVVPFT